MRQSLMKTFDDIYVLDLHGNSKKKERCPDGSKDENVFDIQQGVSINIFVKHLNGNKEKATVHHADLWGDREFKYNWLGKNDLTTTQWTTLQPQSPFYLFVPQNNNLKAEYEQGWKITEAMPINVNGFMTHRDHFAIDFEKEKLHQRIEEMRDESISDYEYTKKYEIKDNRDWKLREARKAIRCDAEWQNKLIPCLYRPFDKRSCYFSTVAMDYPRRELINNVAGKDNLCLGIGRQGIAVNDPVWSLISVSTEPIDSNVFRRGGINVFPLFIYPETNISQPSVFEKEQRNPNFSQDFLKDITEKLGYLPISEAIFYYIYAVLNSPTYRDRYAEFLKIDFPRIPLTSNDELFRQLAEYGEQLVQLHLMTSPKFDNLITEFVEGEGECLVAPAHPKYKDGEVHINKNGDKFIGVPEEVWNFYVGGLSTGQKL
jgi:predicted helicase